MRSRKNSLSLSKYCIPERSQECSTSHGLVVARKSCCEAAMSARVSGPWIWLEIAAFEGGHSGTREEGSPWGGRWGVGVLGQELSCPWGCEKALLWALALAFSFSLAAWRKRGQPCRGAEASTKRIV